MVGGRKFRRKTFRLRRRCRLPFQLAVAINASYAAAVEVTEREDLRSRSPSPELPAPEFPDTDPLASSTDTEPMTPDQS